MYKFFNYMSNTELRGILTISKNQDIVKSAESLMTYRNHAHNLYHAAYEEVLKSVGYKIIAATGELKPDTVCMNNCGEIIAIDYTVSGRNDIIIEKYKKYQREYTKVYVCTLTDFFGKELGTLNFTRDLKIFTENFQQCLRDFDKKLMVIGITKDDLHEVQKMYEHTTKKEKKLNFEHLEYIEDYKYDDEVGDQIPILSGLTDIFKALMEDEEIIQKYELRDTTDTILKGLSNTVRSEMEKKYTENSRIKPTFLFFSPMNKNIQGHTYLKDQEMNTPTSTRYKKEEQRLLENQLRWLCIIDNPLTEIAVDMLKTLQLKQNREIFEDGIIHGDFDERTLKSEYNAHVEETGDTEGGFLHFLGNKLNLDVDTLKVTKIKTLKCERPIDPDTLSFFLKSKTAMTKTDYISEKLKKAAENLDMTPRKCSMKAMDEQDGVLERYISKLCENGQYQKLPFLVESTLYDQGADAEIFYSQKREYMTQYENFLSIFEQSPLLSVFFKMKEFMDQTMHLQELTLTQNNYSIYNCGCENTMYFMRHSSMDKGKDTGKAFCIVYFGELSAEEIMLYGFENTYQNVATKIYITNWRRLPSSRICFHSDQPMSVLSTSFNTFARRVNEKYRKQEKVQDSVHTEIMQTTVFRMLIGMQHSQIFSEMLTDMRYIFLHAFSDFSDVAEFVKDKLCKPIRNFMEHQLIKKLDRFQLLRQDALKDGILEKIAVFVEDKRDLSTIGGYVNLSSIYTNGRMRNIQDLLDEMFIYVHTNKESSSQYHEYVKAVTTILKFQNAYDSLSEKQKFGDVSTLHEFKELLLHNKCDIGFSKNVIAIGVYEMSKRLSGKEDIIRKTINKKISEMTILDINSTKACIPENRRDFFNMSAKSKGMKNTNANEVEDIDEFIHNVGRHDTKQSKKIVELWNKTNGSGYKVMSTKGENSNIATKRCKVHDSTLDILESKKVPGELFEMAKWNLLENNSRVHADICIKEQYGSKREFYVINHGAKAMAKIVEICFQVIGKSLDEEMISIPGDKKMYNIQTLVDSASKVNTQRNLVKFFCNGDCTKWSAAETMQSFETFLKYIPNNTISKELKIMCLNIFKAWRNKTIEFPNAMSKNLYYKGKNLISDQIKTGNMKSTQNFLQGMFNYASSCKAVACTYATEYLWKRIYPQKTLVLSHMEHSDDYAFVVLMKNATYFKQFKLFHRLIMRCFGINDSKKKTNCQRVMLEFISLISFNGVMVYPEIKKVKEVGLNIGCLGFQQDISNTVSRVGEAVRLGLPHCPAYIMSRIHNVRICDAYGLLGYNNDVYDYNFKILAAQLPTDSWGVPDMHPAFYLYTTGNTNNYRIMRYGTPFMQNLVKATIMLSLSPKTPCEDLEDIDNNFGLTTLSYTFLRDTKKLQGIKRNLEFSFQDALQYQEEHPIDSYVKPRDPARYISWLKSKYYIRTFSEAYMMQSRAKMVLRLSHFVKSDCVVHDLSHENFKTNWLSERIKELRNTCTIKDYMGIIIDIAAGLTGGMKVDSLNEKDTRILKNSDAIEIIVCDGDLNVKYIYENFHNCLRTDIVECCPSYRAYVEPKKNLTFNIKEDVGTLLQYKYSENDFVNDCRTFRDVCNSIEDIQVLNRLDRRLQVIPKSQRLRLVHNLLANEKISGKPILMVENPHQHLLKAFELSLRDMCYHRYKNKLTFSIARELQKYSYSGNEFLGISEKSVGNEFALPLDDIALLITLYNVETHADTETCTEELMETIVNMGNEELELSDYLDTLESHVRHGRIILTPKQYKIYAFLQLLLTGNANFVSEYMETQMGLLYKYYDDGAEGRTVEYKINNKDYLAHIKDDIVYLRFAHSNFMEIPLAYITAQRLFSQISLSRYLQMADTVHIKDIRQISKIDDRLGDQLFCSIDKGRITLLPNLDIDKALPVYRMKELNIDLEGAQQDTVHQNFVMDFENLTIKAGNAKLFTLPVLQCKQSNMLTTNTCIDSFCDINYLLKKNRLEKIITNDWTTLNTEGFDKVVSTSFTKVKYFKHNFFWLDNIGSGPKNDNKKSSTMGSGTMEDDYNQSQEVPFSLIDINSVSIGLHDPDSSDDENISDDETFHELLPVVVPIPASEKIIHEESVQNPQSFFNPMTELGKGVQLLEPVKFDPSEPYSLRKFKSHWEKAFERMCYTYVYGNTNASLLTYFDKVGICEKLTVLNEEQFKRLPKTTRSVMSGCLKYVKRCLENENRYMPFEINLDGKLATKTSGGKRQIYNCIRKNTCTELAITNLDLLVKQGELHVEETGLGNYYIKEIISKETLKKKMDVHVKCPSLNYKIVRDIESCKTLATDLDDLFDI